VLDFAPLLLIWFVSDHLALLFDWLKFRRFAAYHAWSAKLGGLLLMSALFWLFAVGRNDFLLGAALIAAILAHFERMIITAILPVWTPDVAHFRAALRLRRAAR